MCGWSRGRSLLVSASSAEGGRGFALTEIDEGTGHTELTIDLVESTTTEVWVTDVRGLPLAGVNLGTEEEEVLGRTDESGHCTLKLSPAQKGLELWASKPGYCLAWQTWAPEKRELFFRLSPGGTISGRVVDSQGRPQANVRVTPLLGEREDIRDKRRRRGAFAVQKGGARVQGTDSKGTFALQGFEGRWADLHVRPPKSCAFEVKDVLVGTEGLVIVLLDESQLGLTSGVALLIRVTDSETRSPVSGVSVSAFYVPNPNARSFEDSQGGTTNADGRVRIAYPQEGHYQILLSAEGYSAPEPRIDHFPPGVHEVSYEMTPSGELELHLVDAGGRGKEGYWIRAMDSDGKPVSFAHFIEGSGSVSSEVMTDLEGRVVANRMPRGQLVLEVRSKHGADGPVLLTERVEIRPGERVERELRLP